MSQLPFGARLSAALDAHGALCVGVDPHAALLRAWGLPDSADGAASFAAACLEAFAGRVALVKPQSAFFERFGAAGIAVLEDLVAGLRSAGTLVLLDVKRGDIGSTMQAYADAYLDPRSPLAADAITVSPFLGIGSLEPAFAAASAHRGGVFALAFTSNPEAGDVQRARRDDGAMVGAYVVDALARLNAAELAELAAGASRALGSHGVVVGATIADELPVDLAALRGPILAPGVGAQGGTPDTVRRIFDGALAAVVPSVSREVLAAGPSPEGLRAAAGRLVDEFAYLRR